MTGAETAAAGGYVGRRMRRLEDAPLVTGHGCYAGDIHLPGLVHMAVLRSPLPHARIRSLDVEPARSMPGVLGAWTADHLPGVGPWMPDTVAGVLSRPRPVLAASEVRYVGEPLAVVVADSAYLAADAIEAISIDLDPVPAVAGVLEAASKRAPLVHADVAGNLAGSILRAKGDLDAAFGPGAVVERGRFSMARIAAAAMEPRTGTAVWRDGVLTLWASTAGHFRVRDALASTLALNQDQVRVLVADVGGSFGSRVVAYPEDVLAAAAARSLGRPVRYVLSRSEDMLSTNQGHGVVLEMELAADPDGRFRGLRGTVYFPIGAYAGGGVPERPLQHLLSAYRLPAVRLELRAYFTNTAPTAAVRGGGRPVGNYGIERIVDRLARRLEMDPLELRRRNLIGPAEMPYDTGVEFGTSRIVYDSGDFPRLLDSAAAALSYEELRRRQQAGEQIGIGLTAFTESTGLGGPEPARARIEPSGRARFSTGSAPSGQGHLTTLAQVAAERLGWPIDQVEVVAGDSRAVWGRAPTGGSRTAIEAGNAVGLAAASARRILRERAGARLEADAADIVVSPAGGWVRGSPSRRVAIAELVGEDGLEVEEVFEAGASTFASGAVGVVVTVDPETQLPSVRRCVFVHDSGREINPMVVEGQVHGGYAHGLGYALFEDMAYDLDSAPRASTFLDYAIASAPEVSEVPEVIALPTSTSHNPEGFKGTGESGAVPIPGAVAAAVEDALQRRSRPGAVNAIPITPMRLFESDSPRQA